MHTTHQRPTAPALRRLTLAATAAALIASGCSSSPHVISAGSVTGSSAVTSTSDTTFTSTASTVPASTTASTTASSVAPTTVAPATTVPVTTPPTTAPAPAPLTLRGNGIGGFDFGTPYDAVVAGVTAQLVAESDVTAEFPVANEGVYQSADYSRGFTSPFARLACWADGGGDHVCLSFGGADPTGLRFVGWDYSGTTLRSTSGVTGGSLWSEFPSMAEPGTAGCFTETSGSIDGIFLVLVSNGAEFSHYDDLGNLVPSYPDPAGVSVRWMEAGDNPHDLEGDC